MSVDAPARAPASPPAESRAKAPLSPSRRARARRARLLWSAGVAPVVAALLWFAWPMVGAGLAVRSVSHAVAAGHRPGSFWLDAVADHDVVELWRGDYNQGTVRLLAGEGWAAVEPLRRALDAVPEVKKDGYAQYCMVLENLALAYDAQAEHTTDTDEADRATADAAQLRKDPRCSDGSDAQSPPQPSTQGTPQDGQGNQGGDDADEQERQRELEDRQRGSDADSEQFRQGGTPDLTSPGNPDRRPGNGSGDGLPQNW